MQNILITGGSGLVGKALGALLKKNGYSVSALSRNKSSQKETYYWNIEEGYIDPEAILNADAIIHLAGENVATKRWTTKRKEELLNSRTLTTKLLLKKVKEYNPNLKAFISASAIGYYVTSFNQIMTEESSHGNDFLAKICVEWEKEVLELQSITRVAIFRIGVVLSGKGGAYAEIAKPIRLGLGAVLGSGKQPVSWIHINDLCKLFLKALEDENIHGIYNAVAPEKINQYQLTYSIAKSLGKKIRLPNVPAFALKLMLGERSDILLKGCKVSSQKIIDAGFQFEFENLLDAVSEIENQC